MKDINLMSDTDWEFFCDTCNIEEEDIGNLLYDGQQWLTIDTVEDYDFSE